MTLVKGQPSKDDWIVLSEACQLASREKIAAWCRDGVVRSLAGLRASRIRHVDIRTNETIAQENVALDPADWASNALGDLRGPHWNDGEARFEFGEKEGPPFGLNMVLVGGALYRVQVHRADRHQMLEAASPTTRRGRPKGGGYIKSDKAIIAKMRAALANGDFTSPTAAAAYFAKEAKGGGTEESKAKRLVTRYKEGSDQQQFG